MASGAAPGELVDELIGSGRLTGKRTERTSQGDSARTPDGDGIAERKARECAGELPKSGFPN